MMCQLCWLPRRAHAPAVANNVKVINAVGRIKVLNKTTRPRPAQRGARLQIPVENRGFEPLTSAVRSQRSTN